MTNQISFKANFIKQSTIKKCRRELPNKEFFASFVELNPHSINDRKALRGAESIWGEGETFASNILHDFENEYLWQSTNKKYYALTHQRNQLDIPVANKILGLAEVITGNDRIKIKYLQTDPQNKHNSQLQKFKGIGTAILDSLKSIFPQGDIVLESTETAINFYKENGFEKINNGNNMIFKRSTSTDLPK